MPKASSSTKSPASPQELPSSYEAALQALDAVVGQLESGELPLDQLLERYQHGSQLLQLCRDKLQAVEEQVKVLDGQMLKPWKPQ